MCAGAESLMSSLFTCPFCMANMTNERKYIETHFQRDRDQIKYYKEKIKDYEAMYGELKA